MSIYIRDKTGSIAAEIFWEGWGSLIETASALLVNLIISRTQSNSKTYAYTLVCDGAQLILAHNGSIMPGSSAFTRILTNSQFTTFCTYNDLDFGFWFRNL
jgi:hypothetical protein